ncbi:MAG: cell surface protein SprA [Calditrichaeota bacterium]|nr:MAG: cell surface protein SprA [Calditrichota bacterium]
MKKRFYFLAVMCCPLLFVFTPYTHSGLFAQQPSAFQQTDSGYVRFDVQFPMDPRTPLRKEISNPGMSLSGWLGGFEYNVPGNIKHQMQLDSSGQFITVTQTIRDVPVSLPNFISIEEYNQIESKRRIQENWRTAAVMNVIEGPSGRRKGPGGLNISIPVPIKSKTFQKIFGGDKVGLNVQGDISIKGGFRNEDRSEAKTTLAQGSNTNFKMNQTQRFTVTGKIGEKVTVNVDQDSERSFDFDNNLKLNYTGFDDEIIESIEAGNISLALPGTRFVRASGGSAGLFGIKTKIKLGDLGMTIVASQEKGESSELSINGGAASNKSTIKDIDFKEFTYFFLDSSYRDNFQNYASKWLRYAVDDPIRRIFVYKSTTDLKRTSLVKGWALPNPSVKSDTSNSGSKEYFTGSFIPLESQLDYFLEPDMGYIYMSQPVASGEVLAVAYELESGAIVGDVDYDPSSPDPIFLKIVKTQSPHPDDEFTWDLAWKNVYNLGSRNIPQEGFSLRILYQSSTGSEEASTTGETYLNIFGLDNYDENGGATPDDLMDLDPYLINLARGELIFPHLEPFNPTDLGGDIAQASGLDDALRTPEIYELERTATARRSASKFLIEVESQNKSSTYQLGFNVIENSEKVIANGRTLQRGIGYTIEYMSGTLTILDEQATAPNAKLDITYERNQFFQLDKKTMLGARAEYKINDNSFVGATFMYLNERTLDQKVRVGKGPMRNMIWDVNGSFKFKPNFLTRAVDALPLLRADADSRLNFEGEVAQILPNPNTLNSSATGDNQGVAYIDDFEGAERPTPLGIMRKGWTDASAPVLIQGLFDDNKHVMAQRGKMIWYNPYTRVSINDIWPERETNSQTGQLADILVMEFTPSEYESRPVSESWHGVMRGLSSGFFNQSESKFLEVTIAGETGAINIDLGMISEDVIPNGKLDSEDLPISGVRLGTLEDEEDIGLDGMIGSDTGTDPDFWDINGDGERQLWEPLSNDDWAYSQSSGNYSRINGTENSKNDGSQIPDTEDLNRNNVVDLVNSYFSYNIDLDDPNHPYFVGYTNPNVADLNNRYRLYRIPLNVLANADDPDYRSVQGKPDLSNIQYARLWMTGVDTLKTVRLKIAEINLTGNDWKEQGIADDEKFASYIPTDGGPIDDKTISVSVLNTHDNPDNYIEPPGVSGVVDRITKARAKEQALALKVTELQSGFNGIVKKTLLEKQDYIHYKRLKMFVAAFGTGLPQDTSLVQESPIEFFLRFGSDENNYYEIREPLYGPDAYVAESSTMWNEANELDVELFELTSMKMLGEGVQLINPADSKEQIYYKNVGEKEYRFKGIPSISNVRVFWVGIINKSTSSWSGEVWLNELRLSNIEKEKGIAMRASVDFGLSDLLSVNADINRQDADFHNVGERFGKGSTSQSYSVNTSVKVDKFLPQGWGLSIPVSANYSKSKTTPKYDPSLGDIVLENAGDESLIEDKLTRAENKGFNISLSKAKKSRKFYIKYTLDALKGKISHTRSTQTAPTIKLSNAQNWSGNVDYSVTFGQSTFFNPLKFLKTLPLIGKYSETKLYYLPRSFSASASGASKWSERQTRSLQGEDGKYSTTSTRTLNRNANLSYKLTDKLSSTLSRAWAGDVRGGWLESFTAVNDTSKYVDRSKSQNFKMDFSPEIFSFFTNSFSYSSAYKFSNNPAQTDRALSASTNNTVSASGTLKFSKLFQRKSSGSKGRKPTTQRKRPGRRKPGESGAEKEKDGKEGSEDGEKKSRPNPLNLLKSLVKNIGSVKDIKVSYSDRNNFTNSAVLAEPGNRYKFGFVDKSFVRDIPYSENATGNLVGINGTKSLNMSTGFKITKAIDVSLKYDLSDQTTQSTQTTGNFSSSQLRIKNESSDTSDVFIPFPDITITWNGLEKIGPLKRVFKTFNLSSNFTFKTATYWQDNKDNKTKDDYQLSQRPLVRASMTLKNGITSNFAMNHSVGEGQSFSQNGDVVLLNTGNRNTTDDISFSASYSKRSGFSLPFPFLKNKKLDNSVDISITYSSSSTRGERWSKSDEKWTEFTSSKRWSFQPKMTYSFSSRVRGGAHFELGVNKSNISGETKIKEFLIDVNISIRGN